MFYRNSTYESSYEWSCTLQLDYSRLQDKATEKHCQLEYAQPAKCIALSPSLQFNLSPTSHIPLKQGFITTTW